jgi:MFS family permease
VAFTSFQRVLGAEIVSVFGSLMSRLALPWLAVLVLGAGPAAMAWLAVADVVAGAGSALLLGALVDRLPKRRVMVAADVLRAAALLAIPLLGWCGVLSIGWLIAITAFNGMLTVAFELAQSAWLARASAAHELTGRNAQLAAGGAVTEAVSFGITGWIFQLFGAFVSIVADALTYVVSALFLWRLPEPPAAAGEPHPAPPRSALRALADDVSGGLRAVRDDHRLRGLAEVAVLTAFAGSFARTGYMIYVSRDIAFGTGVLGMIFAVGGIGSVFGAWIAARGVARFAPTHVLVAGLALGAAGSLCVPIATSATLVGLVLLVAQQVIGDAGMTAYEVHDRTLRQSLAPPAALARIDSGIRTMGYAATLVGALAGGVLAEWWGVRALLFAWAALLGVAAVVAALRLHDAQAAQRQL